MTTANIIWNKKNPETTTIIAPYNEFFKDEAKAIGGKWDGAGWTLEMNADAALEMVRKHYETTGEATLDTSGRRQSMVSIEVVETGEFGGYEKI